MENTKEKIEAILFVTGKFMDLDEISKLCGIGSVGIVKNAINELKNDYENRNSALEIFEENGKWKLNIKKEFNYLTTSLLDNSEMDSTTTKTLALIAYKQPVLQSEIIKMRGNGAYDHIKMLREQEFIFAEKKGRSRLLKLTPKFFDYFDVVEKEIKLKLGEHEQKTE